MNRVSERNLGRFRSCTLTCKTKKYKQVCQFQHFCLIYELSKNCQRTLEYKYQYEIPHLINLNFLYVEKSLLLLRQQLVFNFKLIFSVKIFMFFHFFRNRIKFCKTWSQSLTLSLNFSIFAKFRNFFGLEDTNSGQ